MDCALAGRWFSLHFASFFSPIIIIINDPCHLYKMAMAMMVVVVMIVVMVLLMIKTIVRMSMMTTRIMVIIVIMVMMQPVMMRSFSRRNMTSEAIVQWSASLSAF